jgi:hypothetical protein
MAINGKGVFITAHGIRMKEQPFNGRSTWSPPASTTALKSNLIYQTIPVRDTSGIECGTLAPNLELMQFFTSRQDQPNESTISPRLLTPFVANLQVPQEKVLILACFLSTVRTPTIYAGWMTCPQTY